jgi:hypothetical protein
MASFLSSLLGINIPFWINIVLPIVILILILFILWFVHTRIFKFRLRNIINAQGSKQTAEAIKNFEQHYPVSKLMRYSKRMERYSRQMGPKVVRETGLADKWVQKLTDSSMPRVKDLMRVLLYCPTSAYFKALIAVEQHPRLQKTFSDWMQNEGEE